MEAKEAIKITGNNPYEEVVKIIEDWRHRKNGILDEFLVTISLDGYETTEYLELDDNMDFLWHMDWWEGEKEVYLLGFKPISDIRFYGMP